MQYALVRNFHGSRRVDTLRPEIAYKKKSLFHYTFTLQQTTLFINWAFYPSWVQRKGIDYWTDFMCFGCKHSRCRPTIFCLFATCIFYCPLNFFMELAPLPDSASLYKPGSNSRNVPLVQFPEMLVLQIMQLHKPSKPGIATPSNKIVCFERLQR